VIDLSGSKPVIGFAKEDEGNNTSKKETKQSQPNYYSYYPPQPLLQLLASSILLLCPSRGIFGRKDLEKDLALWRKGEDSSANASAYASTPGLPSSTIPSS